MIVILLTEIIAGVVAFIMLCILLSDVVTASRE